MTSKENLDIFIQTAEEKWLEKSKQFVEKQFETVFLPSHDLIHHLRTWKHAKYILRELSELNSAINLSIVEATLLASIFHDTGMVHTRSPEHGLESKKIYQEFINKEGTELPEYQNEILRAIEYHDNKEEFVYVAIEINAPPDILTIISISDDIDALGTIGIYRYVEIYLHRHTSMRSLGIKVLKNVSFRFNHLVKASYLLPSFVNHMKILYKEIINFFDHYNQQILIESEPETTFSGHIGIVNYIRQFCVEGKIKPEDFFDSLSNFQVGNSVLTFFKDLDIALNEQSN
ncbi:MAG: HD domain-containing protein [Bacteroidales bacterium]|jgi:HD superfamily phosphodiesterase|nr:HD domain-containing protein [Bacteroidales bacterium]